VIARKAACVKRIVVVIAAVPRITSAASYTTSATVTPATAPRGGKATITTAVKSSSSMKLLVDLEIYSPSGQADANLSLAQLADLLCCS
jgi:hypothetical protein